MSDPVLPEESWDVFLAHNSADKPLAKQLWEALTKGRDDWVHPEHPVLGVASRGFRCFLDQESLAKGALTATGLSRALERSSCMALLVGPAGLGRWQGGIEADTAIALHQEGRLRIAVVHLPGGPEPGHLEGDLAAMLGAYNAIDLRTALADDGTLSEEGWIDLIAGILGLSRDRINAEVRRPLVLGRALLVGVTAGGEGFPPLLQVDADLKRMQALLGPRQGASWALESPVVDPTRAGLEARVNAFFRGEPGDGSPVKLFYFSGHGKPTGGALALAMVASTVDDVHLSGYSSTTLVAELENYPGRKVVILDCCGSAIPKSFVPDGVALFASAESWAPAGSGDQPSPFTQAIADVVDGLEPGEELTTGLLRDRLAQHVPLHTNDTGFDATIPLLVAGPRPNDRRRPAVPVARLLFRGSSTVRVEVPNRPPAASGEQNGPTPPSPLHGEIVLDEARQARLKALIDLVDGEQLVPAHTAQGVRRWVGTEWAAQLAPAMAGLGRPDDPLPLQLCAEENRAEAVGPWSALPWEYLSLATMTDERSPTLVVERAITPLPGKSAVAEYKPRLVLAITIDADSGERTGPFARSLEGRSPAVTAARGKQVMTVLDGRRNREDPRSDAFDTLVLHTPVVRSEGVAKLGAAGQETMASSLEFVLRRDEWRFQLIVLETFAVGSSVGEQVTTDVALALARLGCAVVAICHHASFPDLLVRRGLNKSFAALFLDELARGGGQRLAQAAWRARAELVNWLGDDALAAHVGVPVVFTPEPAATEAGSDVARSASSPRSATERTIGRSPKATSSGGQPHAPAAAKPSAWDPS